MGGGGGSVGVGRALEKQETIRDKTARGTSKLLLGIGQGSAGRKVPTFQSPLLLSVTCHCYKTPTFLIHIKILSNWESTNK